MTARSVKLTKAGLPKQAGAKPGQRTVQPYVRTDEMAEKIMAYVACGVTTRQLEIILRMSYRTINEHYAHEVEHGRLIKIAKLGVSMYQRAIDGDTSAAKFVLERQGAKYGWRPKDTIDFEAEIAPAVGGSSITVRFVRPADDVD